MKNIALPTNVKVILRRLLHFITTYRIFIFFLLVCSLYGFIVWRINVLTTAEPTQTELKNAGQTTSPRISKDVVEKMQSMQDNSVRVQTIFNEARNNPFQE
ncbi:MAG: hypothetical protein WBO35_01240 [Candidatus Saccharimonadales bacterium]